MVISSGERRLPQSKDARKLLEALVMDNRELEALEEQVCQLNIFEAIGCVRQELRHSDFLTFLLNPRQNHGLGDAFLKRILQKASLEVADEALRLNPIDLDTWSLEDADILREWQHIDILVLNKRLGLAVIIENKIRTSEYSNQLKTYFERVQKDRPGWKVLGFYLCPENERPDPETLSDQRFVTIDYKLVCEILEDLVKRRGESLNEPVRRVLSEYARMLRRHYVSDRELEELCHLGSSRRSEIAYFGRRRTTKLE
jgi:hypothetical protein